MKAVGAIKKLVPQRVRNSRGNAMVETLPLIVIFVTLLAFGIGFFTVIHTAILNSIGARTYAFETFRNRSDVTYFRDTAGSAADILQYSRWGNRIHAIGSEKDPNNNADDESQISATARGLAFGQTLKTSAATSDDHNNKIYTILGRNRSVNASPAWIMVAYGICLDANCGDGAP